MDWVAYFVVFVVAHVVGDFLFQTDSQAMHKYGGLGRDPVARKALFGHVATYSLPVIGACAWIATMRPIGLTVLAGALVTLEHLVQDDGRLLRWYCRRVKGLDNRENPGVAVWIDQAFHVVVMFAAALLLTL